MISTSKPGAGRRDVPAAPSGFKRSADVLWSAAKDVHTAVHAEDGVPHDTRQAVDAMTRALGELGSAAAELDRLLAHSDLRSRELELRVQELVASLLGARRNGELVCRHLPSRA